jgi:hypothetical protein
MWLLPITVILLSILVAIPVSTFMARIMDGKYKPWPIFGWFEKRLDSGPQNWKQYTVTLLFFNTVLFLFGYLVLSVQPWMPLNPRGLGMIAPTTIFNTVMSFATNTDIQHYSGDQAFSNFSQIFFCIPMFFLSAAIGLCALAAIIRAFLAAWTGCCYRCPLRRARADAPALAQADVGLAMNSGTQAAKEAGNMVDLDSDPTKLIEVVEIGKQLLMTRGALTTFSVANDVAKYFAIVPALFAGTLPWVKAMDIMNLHSPTSAILSAVIFNALIIPALIPVALKGVKYVPLGADALLKRNLLIWGLGGVIMPFAGIKIIDVVLSAMHMVA